MCIGVCVLAPKKTLSRLLSFLKLNPFRKFSFLSSLKTSITFPGRGEAATTPSLGLLNTFQRLFVAVMEKPTGRLGSLSAMPLAFPSPVQGPLYTCFSITGRAKGTPQALTKLAPLSNSHGGTTMGQPRDLRGGWLDKD